MKKTFITRQMELVFWSNRKKNHRKTIHEQLAETIAERNRILSRLMAPKDIHQQLQETIALLKLSAQTRSDKVHLMHPGRPLNTAA